jgi:hypothetical protein
VTEERGQSDVVPCAHNAIVCTRRQHKTSCLGSLPGASISRILSPNIIIHWRFSENECQVPRLEVSPRTRKTGVRGRVVEIGAIDNLGGQLDAAYGLLLNLLPNLPAAAERQPSKQRKARRGKRASV